MAEHWESGAVKHPGRMKRLAQREGISVHAAEVRASHSKDPSLRAAGNLGLTFARQARARRGKHTLAGRGGK